MRFCMARSDLLKCTRSSTLERYPREERWIFPHMELSWYLSHSGALSRVVGLTGLMFLNSILILICVRCNRSAILTTSTIAKMSTGRPRRVGRKRQKRRSNWSKKGKRRRRRREERSIITAQRAPGSSLEMLTLVGPHIHGCRPSWNRSRSKSEITLGLRLESSENVANIVSVTRVPVFVEGIRFW